MFSTSDTIVAIATPAGRGGLGVIRISGPDAPRIADELDRPRSAPQAPARDVRAGVADWITSVVTLVSPSPRSYTGEDVVEISAHGSPVVLSSILRAAIDAGARLAEPGEFTLRAFLNGKLDLVQAEAVADLIDAVTPLQARAAFDQLEGHADDGDRGDRKRSVRHHREARGVARFPGRGLSLRGAEGSAARRSPA